MANFISFPPSDNFNTALYDGTGSSQAVTGVGFQPDLVWLKNRPSNYVPVVFDSVRGVQEQLVSSTTAAESTEASTLTAFGADGFTVISANEVNRSGDAFVGWNWRGGTTSGITTNGSTTITPLAYSFNADAGISIIKFTGNDTAGAGLPHGLGVAPQWVVCKTLGGANNWNVYQRWVGNQYWIDLNDSAAKGTATNRWNDTDPDSVNVYLGSTGATNGSGGDSPIICYAFAPKKGFSFMGKYEGNGNADGPFQFSGFRPAFLMIRNMGSGDWFMYDSKREGYNEDNDYLKANENTLEQADVDIDLLSNGFKIRNTSSGQNGAGSNYVWLAFAVFPVVSSNSKAGVAR